MYSRISMIKRHAFASYSRISMTFKEYFFQNVVNDFFFFAVKQTFPPDVGDVVDARPSEIAFDSGRRPVLFFFAYTQIYVYTQGVPRKFGRVAER